MKVVDPSANPYLATAAILGLALAGIQDGAPLPREITVDPAGLSASDRHEAGVAQLPHQQVDVIAALDGSQRLREILGDPVLDALVAVRRYEQHNYADRNAEELTDKFRMAWSV